ncbi:MAG: S8 family serine peptidase [Steroidobacteraceae bacterium]
MSLCSFGGSALEPGGEPEHELVDELLAHDIVPVVAAGNAGPAAVTIGEPASSHSAIAVGAANLAHNQRVVVDLAAGLGVGALYRPFDGPLMAFFSSRGPDADGRVQPHVVANGFASFGMGDGSTGSIGFAYGTSFSTPAVAGIAAVLRQRFPSATARQIRNAIITSANPALVNAADALDQGHGYVNAKAAADLLAGGAVPDTVEASPEATPSVKITVEQNTPLKVVDGFVRQTLSLRPGERHEILYQVLPNTSQVIVSLSNFSASLPPGKQNQLFGDDLFFGVHSAKSSSIGDGDYLVPLQSVRGGTSIVNNPETGLMRVSLTGDWTNAGSVSVNVSVMSLTDPVPQFTSHGKIVSTQLRPCLSLYPTGPPLRISAWLGRTTGAASRPPIST